MDDTSESKKNSVWRYYRIYLSICGVCIPDDRNHKIYSWVVGFASLLATLQLLYSAYYFMDEIESCAVAVHHTILIFDSLYAAAYYFFNRHAVRELVPGMKAYHYESLLVREYASRLEEERVRRMTNSFKLIVATHLTAIIDLAIAGVLEKYLRDLDYLLQFPCWFPFDVSYVPYNAAALLWQHILVDIATGTVFSALALIYLVCSYITTQLEVLKFAIENVKEMSVELASNLDPKTVRNTNRKRMSEPDARLKRGYIIATRMCAEHHSQIISYFNLADGVFRLIYFLIFISGFLLLTFTGFALISNNTSLKLKFVLVTIIQLIFLYVACLFGEQVAEKSDDIRLAIYSIQWYDMPKECLTSLRLMMVRTMKPLEITTLTGQKVDLNNYMSMIKASYSYFNMMLATQE